MKKHIICILSLLLCMTGCKKIEDAVPAYETMPSLTALTTPADAEETSGSSTEKISITEETRTETALQTEKQKIPKLYRRAASRKTILR